MILGYIKSEIYKENPSIDKLIILLSFYNGELEQETIDMIESKIDELIQNFVKYYKETPGMERQLVELINKFLSMDWPQTAKKYQLIIKYINQWEKDLNPDTERTINKFLKNMPSLQDTKIY